MSSSGDEDDPQGQAKGQAQMIVNSVKKLLDRLGKEDDESEETTKVQDAGSRSVKLLEKIYHRIYHFQSGIISFEEIEDQIEEFVFSYQMYSHQSGIFKEVKRTLLEIQLTLAELGKGLTILNEGRVSTNPNKNTQEVQETTSDKIGENIEDADKSNSEMENVDVSLRKRIRFVNVSPKADLVKTYECHICEKKYVWLKALKKHMKQNHNNADVVGEHKEVDDRITCRCCNSKQSRDLIVRHLRDVHGFMKLNPGTSFRGFISLDEGVTWKPLFLQKNEDDPPHDFLCPVEEDGSVVVFGSKFKKGEFENEEIEDAANLNVINQGEYEEVLNVKDGNLDEPIEEEMIVDEVKESRNKAGDDLEEKREAKNVTDSEPDEVCDMNDPGIIGLVDLAEKVSESKESDTKNVYYEDVEDMVEVNEDEDKEYQSGEKRKSIVRNLLDEFTAEDEKGEIKKPKMSVTVTVLETCVKVRDLWSVDSEENEDIDSEEETDLRREMKKLRYEDRNVSANQTKVCEQEENAGIIKEFEVFIRDLKFDNPNNKGDLSTIRKNLGHLFLYQDSLLEYEVAKDGKYNLMRLFTPKSTGFLEVSDPTTSSGWIRSIGGPDGKSNPGRRKEQLKSHARFRDFVEEKVKQTQFGTTGAELFRKENVINNLKSVTANIKKKGTFGALAKLENLERNERLKAREVLNPGVDFKELNSVKDWFHSDLAQEEEKANLRNYDKCITGQKLGDKEFLKFSNWVRFSVALEDRNRRSVYNFSNGEFSERRPKWLPKGKSEDEISNYIFQKLPEGWNPDISPLGDDEEPSCWVVNVSPGTKGMKGHRPGQIVLSKKSLEICLKLRDLKVECIKSSVEDEDPFFVNIKNKPIAALQRTPGSLLSKFAKVTGVEDATMTTLRRAAEVRVQDSPEMKRNIEKLQSHSSNVGLRHYDRSDTTARANFINQLSEMELPKEDEIEVPDSVMTKRKKLDQMEKKRILEKAKEKLKQDRFRKKESTNKKCKLVPTERRFMQEYFSSSKTGIECGKVFPGIALNSF